MQNLSLMFAALCLIYLPYADLAHGMSLKMGIEDGSYGEIEGNVGFAWELGQSSSSGTFTVSIQNNSETVLEQVEDPDGNPYNVYISPYITSFLFNLPTGVSAALSAVTDGTNSVNGWGMPRATMRSTLIPSPDFHGFWDAGASIGSMFTSGDPSSGIPMGMTYDFEFILSGDVALLSIEDILTADPFFSGPASGNGGGGKKGGKATLTSDDGDDGPATLDWEYYFLANVKGYPEGMVDFELLVPEAEIHYPPAPEMRMMSFATAAPIPTPEPSTLILLALGLSGIVVLRYRRN